VGPGLESRLVAAIRQPRGFVIGVDVGATKIAAGLVDDHSKIFMAMSNGTACTGLNAVVSAIDSLARGALSGATIERNSSIC
jgi:predicted NBD/HSP70 family sugar kinase